MCMFLVYFDCLDCVLIVGYTMLFVYIIISFFLGVFEVYVYQNRSSCTWQRLWEEYKGRYGDSRGWCWWCICWCYLGCECNASSYENIISRVIDPISSESASPSLMVATHHQNIISVTSANLVWQQNRFVNSPFHLRNKLSNWLMQSQLVVLVRRFNRIAQE